MSAAYRCEVCGGDPIWTLTRMGDAVRTWTDDEHLSEVLTRLQRDFEVTNVNVRLHAKAVEWAEIDKTLRAIGEESA